MDRNTIRLYVIEEQELYRNLFQSVYGENNPGDCPINLVGISGMEDLRQGKQAYEKLSAEVVLCSAKKLGPHTTSLVLDLQTKPSMLGIVLLFAQHSPEDTELLRDLATRSKRGMAFFLKQSLDMTAQLTGIISAVARGEFIIDPQLAGPLFMGRSMTSFLSQITTREMEILKLIAHGYTNTAIAETLYIDVKTVERHINNMYSKLKTSPDFDNKHSRVSAARFYLEGTGQLQADRGAGQFPQAFTTRTR